MIWKQLDTLYKYISENYNIMKKVIEKSKNLYI